MGEDQGLNPIEYLDRFFDELRAEVARLSAPVGVEPVAEVLSGWQIVWVGNEPLAHVLARHPGVRIGSKLYPESAINQGPTMTDHPRSWPAVPRRRAPIWPWGLLGLLAFVALWMFGIPMLVHFILRA